jgi:hypothetical protein
LKERRTLIYPDFVFKPEDWLRFVQFNPFVAHWKSLGLADDSLQALEIAIMTAPAAAPIVPGTGGLRKLRFAPPGWHTGKRGALRVCYAYFRDHAVVVLIAAYAKNRKDNLSPAEKTAIKKMLVEIEELLSTERPGRTSQRT